MRTLMLGMNLCHWPAPFQQPPNRTFFANIIKTVSKSWAHAVRKHMLGMYLWHWPAPFQPPLNLTFFGNIMKLNGLSRWALVSSDTSGHGLQASRLVSLGYAPSVFNKNSTLKHKNKGREHPPDFVFFQYCVASCLVLPHCSVCVLIKRAEICTYRYYIRRRASAWTVTH